MSEAVFQIGVKALVRNDKGYILLLGKKRVGDIVTYDFPGGRLDLGESPMAALRRELQEEAGIAQVYNITYFDATVTKLKPKTEYGEVGLLIMLYKAEYNVETPIKIGADEHDFEWFSPQDTADLIGFKYHSDFCEKIAQLA